MQGVKQFKAAVNRKFNENCGIYWHHLNDAQLIDYGWARVREFVSNGGKTLVATLTTGRQPNMKKKNAQGELVDLDELDQSYLDVLKDAIDDFDDSTYVINEKLQVKLE
jgi:hypothetical protein